MQNMKPSWKRDTPPPELENNFNFGKLSLGRPENPRMGDPILKMEKFSKFENSTNQVLGLGIPVVATDLEFTEIENLDKYAGPKMG